MSMKDNRNEKEENAKGKARAKTLWQVVREEKKEMGIPRGFGKKRMQEGGSHDDPAFPLKWKERGFLE